MDKWFNYTYNADNHLSILRLKSMHISAGDPVTNQPLIYWLHGWWPSSFTCQNINLHDDVIKWKHFPRYWPFVRGIHRSPVNSTYKGQWRGALMFSLICVWINNWVNNREAGDSRRHGTHYDVIVMCTSRVDNRTLTYQTNILVSHTLMCKKNNRILMVCGTGYTHYL